MPLGDLAVRWLYGSVDCTYRFASRIDMFRSG